MVDSRVILGSFISLKVPGISLDGVGNLSASERRWSSRGGAEEELGSGNYAVVNALDIWEVPVFPSTFFFFFLKCSNFPCNFEDLLQIHNSVFLVGRRASFVALFIFFVVCNKSSFFFFFVSYFTSKDFIFMIVF